MNNTDKILTDELTRLETKRAELITDLTPVIHLRKLNCVEWLLDLLEETHRKIKNIKIALWQKT